MARTAAPPEIRSLRSEIRSLEQENQQLKAKLSEMDEYTNHLKKSLFTAVKQNRELREILHLVK